MDHWTKVRDGFTENFKNDLYWLIALRGPKVRDSLKNWGYIASDRCAVCDRKESIDHCFLNCKRSRAVWEYFLPLLSKFIKASLPINVLTIFFFQWTSDDRKLNKVVLFLIKTVLYAIWHFRNKATFHNGTESHKAVIKYAIQDFKRRIKLDHYRLSLVTAFATAGIFPLLSLCVMTSSFLGFNLWCGFCFGGFFRGPL